MNINNISKGQIFKNYKHLCQELNEKVKTGKSKILQLEDWERFFSYTKDGNKIIITKIFEIPEMKIDLRSNGNNKLAHAHELDMNFMYLLNSKEEGKLSKTMLGLLRDMNMINHNYKAGIRNRRKVSNYLNIEPYYIEEFFTVTKRTLSSNIESMLNRLQNRGLLTWSIVTMVCVAEVETEKNELGDIKVNTEITYDEFDNEKLNLSIKTSEQLKFRPATQEEEYIIYITEQKVMEDLNCNNKQEVVIKDMWNIFRKRVKNILQDRINILFYYDSYEIIKGNQLSEFKKINKDDLNNNVQKQLITNWEKRNMKAIETGKGSILRKTDDYMKYGIILIGSFIDCKSENIVQNLNQTKLNPIQKLSL